MVNRRRAGRSGSVLYFQRMQIEESFRDGKALLGLEKERTQAPWERLRSLVWALTVGMALDLQQGDATLQAPARLPLCPKAASSVPPAVVPEYRAESATREGLHTLVVQAVLGTSPFTAELHAMAAKSERMQARPQVRDRRRTPPALRLRSAAKGPPGAPRGPPVSWGAGRAAFQGAGQHLEAAPAPSE
jgi:hypothetical protein